MRREATKGCRAFTGEPAQAAMPQPVSSREPIRATAPKRAYSAMRESAPATSPSRVSVLQQSAEKGDCRTKGTGPNNQSASHLLTPFFVDATLGPNAAICGNSEAKGIRFAFVG